MTEEVAHTMWAARQLGDIIEIDQATSISLTTATRTSTVSTDLMECPPRYGRLDVPSYAFAFRALRTHTSNQR